LKIKYGNIMIMFRQAFISFLQYLLAEFAFKNIPKKRTFYINKKFKK
jgi:hypothetical protein